MYYSLFILFYQASEKKEHKFKFATHMPSKMEQVRLIPCLCADFSVRAASFCYSAWMCQQFSEFITVSFPEVLNFWGLTNLLNNQAM